MATPTQLGENRTGLVLGSRLASTKTIHAIRSPRSVDGNSSRFHIAIAVLRVIVSQSTGSAPQADLALAWATHRVYKGICQREMRRGDSRSSAVAMGTVFASPLEGRRVEIAPFSQARLAARSMR